MKSSLRTSVLLGLAALQVAQARYAMYVDQYHVTTLPNTTISAGIDTVIMAFANSSLFTTSPAGNYTPFEPVKKMRARFDNGTKVMIAIGGWADNAGFSAGAIDRTTRSLFASNIASMLDTHGFDGVDIDWEYPGGNGADYLLTPNTGKNSEIENYPLLLSAIKSAIGPNKLLSIATPALERDMIALTPSQAPSVWKAVDFVNIMTYDIMNRRDNVTKHHTSVSSSLAVVDYYLDVLALPASQANLGFAFYAKYFTVNTSLPCTTGLGCTTVLLEYGNGTDTGLSSAITFEIENYEAAPKNLTESPNGLCGAAAGYFCANKACCSSYGYCGLSDDFCGSKCRSVYGTCNGTSVTDQFKFAMGSGTTDESEGGEYYYNATSGVFWTWDTPKLIGEKFERIVGKRGLGGVFAWSLGEDSWDWAHVLAMQEGAERLRL